MIGWLWRWTWRVVAVACTVAVIAGILAVGIVLAVSGL